MPPSEWKRITRWIQRRRTEDEVEEEQDEEGSLFEPLNYDPELLEHRADISAELDITPAEFVRRIVEVEGGKIRQQDFQKYVNFSLPTLSRLLQNLEAEGEIRRYKVGRENIVTIGDELSHDVGVSEIGTATQSDERGSDAQSESRGSSKTGRLTWRGPG